MWDFEAHSMPLTALKVRTARPGRHADIHGLYLIVRDTGSRSWVLRMQQRGKRRDFGLGPAHDVSLADARALASDFRRMVRSGLDPAKERRVGRKAAPGSEIVARECYEAMKGGWRGKGAVRQHHGCRSGSARAGRAGQGWAQIAIIWP